MALDPRCPMTSAGAEARDSMTDTRRLTVAQALVGFLVNQYSERDGVEQRLVPGCFGIFGHGNVAGLGEALLETARRDARALPYTLAATSRPWCTPPPASRG